jgi:hypothetical protein
VRGVLGDGFFTPVDPACWFPMRVDERAAKNVAAFNDQLERLATE